MFVGLANGTIAVFLVSEIFHVSHNSRKAPKQPRHNKQYITKNYYENQIFDHHGGYHM